jgi:flagellin
MAGIIATNAIISNDRDQEQAMERLSTGKRINSAGDDAAGLAISQRMQAEVSGLKMATRNANDAISMLETAEGASVEITDMLQRMRELAVQAATDTYSLTDRLALDLEFGQLMQEIQNIASQTTWNTMTVMNGGAPNLATDVITSDVDLMNATIQLGKAATQTTTLTLKSWDPRNTIDFAHRNERTLRAGFAAAAYAAGDGQDQFVGAGANFGGTVANQSNSAYGAAVLWTGGDDAAVGGTDTAGGALNADKRINIETRGNATYALTQLDVAITAASSERAQYGAYIRRMEHTGDNLTNVARHQEQSRSRIADADYAIETSELSRTTIIAQASTAMLAQANQSKQIVLALLE